MDIEMQDTSGPSPIATRAVRLSFNPSANPRVDRAKALFAEAIDILLACQRDGNEAVQLAFNQAGDDSQFSEDHFYRLGEQSRNCDAAIELITQASMRTVHALTSDISLPAGNEVNVSAFLSRPGEGVQP